MAASCDVSSNEWHHYNNHHVFFLSSSSIRSTRSSTRSRAQRTQCHAEIPGKGERNHFRQNFQPNIRWVIYGVACNVCDLSTDERMNACRQIISIIFNDWFTWIYSLLQSHKGYLLFKDFCENVSTEPVPHLKFYEEVRPNCTNHTHTQIDRNESIQLYVHNTSSEWSIVQFESIWVHAPQSNVIVPYSCLSFAIHMLWIVFVWVIWWLYHKEPRHIHVANTNPSQVSAAAAAVY